MSAIVLDAVSPIGLTIIRELGSRGVVVHAVGRGRRSIGAASRFAAFNYVRPTAPLADWVPGLIARTGAKALLAVNESDLVELAAMPAEIGGCAILTPRDAQLSVVLDKAQTLSHAASIGIDVPGSWQPEEGQDFTERAGGLAYPVVVKWADPPSVMPALEQSGIEFNKAELVADETRLVAVLARYSPLGRWPLVQQYCPGHGLGQMIHMADGAATMRFQHRRLREWPPEGGVSTACASVPLSQHHDQMTKSEKLLRSIGWQGPAMVEYRHDPASGRYWLMEINGRFWGSLPLASASGATFAWEAYRRAVLGDTRGAAPVRDGLRARYMIPETKRLIRVVFQRHAITDPQFRARPLRDLISYFVDFLRPSMRYYVLRLDDVGPTVRDIANTGLKLLQLFGEMGSGI